MLFEVWLSWHVGLGMFVRDGRFVIGSIYVSVLKLHEAAMKCWKEILSEQRRGKWMVDVWQFDREKY